MGIIIFFDFMVGWFWVENTLKIRFSGIEEIPLEKKTQDWEIQYR